MLQSLLETALLETAGRAAATGLVMGQIVRLTDGGRALVDYAGCEGPVEAASAMTDLPVDGETLVGSPVLLWIDPVSSSPVILGVVRDRLVTSSRAAAEKRSRRRAAKSDPLQVRIDGEQVVLEAKQQIELRCGESSITLRKDGRILVKGTDLVSRAARCNRIKGASVEIN
jgi:hypothetical protein